MDTIEGKKQVGVIIAGAGINFRAWIDEAKSRGFTVRICEGYCELYA